LGTGSLPILDFGDVSSESLPVFKDYPGDTFVKVGEIEIDEGLKTPSEPIPHTPTSETLTGEARRKKRIKTTAVRTDLPLVCKFLAQQSKSSSPSSHVSSAPSKPTPKLTRKTFRFAAQDFPRKTSTSKQEPPVIEEIVSSPKGSPTKGSEIAAPKQASPVVGSEQASTESKPPQPPKSLRTPSSRPGSKRKAPSKQGPTAKPAEEPKSKRAKTSTLPAPNLAKFLQRSE